MRRPLLTLPVVLLGLAACGGKPKPETPAPDEGPDRSAVAARPVSVETDRDLAERTERERVAAVLAEAVYFGYDQATLSAAARTTLDAKAVVLRTGADTRLVIGGHADERGSDEYNLALGMRRATAAQRYLIRSGVPASRLEVVSYGEERPAIRGHDEQAYAANRRDEFTSSGPAISRQ